MRCFIAKGALALLALFVVSLVLPVSEAAAGFRRRGGCASCSVGSYSAGYRGTTSANTQAPVPVKQQMTQDNQQAPVPSGYDNRQASQGSVNSQSQKKDVAPSLPTSR